MENAEVFAVLSRCFAPVVEAEWNELSSVAAWDGFLASARRLLQDPGVTPERIAPASRVRKSEPLEDFLAQDEVRALYAPPSATELHMFESRHFTGGLPASAVPIESLYVEWTDREGMNPFGRTDGLYESDAALYMRDLMTAAGIDKDAAVSPYADHLAVELDYAALLFAAGRDEDAWLFVGERFEWLSAYRTRLIQLGDEALFHVAIVDLILGIRAMQTGQIDEVE